ncbi:D-alanyl-D-alanine carboxypeptidase/D-alanyl-D-alanine-endopeptidase [Seohaeicola saemankumensis]|nr:D-alanyl-D-alanine carboxypeptidase/D-alanyl-D-alanine-endopeptidase [Seohaeicola saemankumensis]MCA0871900.1 D-alanyl-D-alanine carboxypeptidase/D-alanyl-D-alanine-endopeptidase [Seohaeicola saemankumensis]
MSNRVSRRFVLGGLSALAGSGAAWANAPTASLRPWARPADLAAKAAGGAEGLIARFGLPGEVVCAVADVQTGLRLESVGGRSGLPPASVAKALTTLYALDVLGGDHRFVTRVLADGPVQNGVLKGDLILAGGGDPTLDTDGLAALAARLKSRGIRELRGKFLVYDGLFPFVRSIDPGQPDHVGYSPAVAGIALNFNRVHFEWKRAGKGYAVSMDARSAKYRPEVDIARMKVANRDVPVYTYADQKGADHWTVANGALGNGGSRWLPVRKPALYAGDVFRTLARSHGIVLPAAQATGQLPGGAQTLAEHRSEALTGILRDMLKYSTNITAEMVGLATTVARGKAPATLRDSAEEMSRWAAAKYGMAGTRMVDHSGLGDASRMTPDDLVGALVLVGRNGLLRPLLKPFAMRNAKGGIDKDHPIKVDAKTGTLNFVSGLGGYLTASDGTELAFAIFTADTARRARIAPQDRERPDGARSWNRKSKQLQQKLIERWGALYGS